MEFSDTTAVDPYFIPDRPGEYVVELTVCDGTQSSEPAVVTIAASEPGEAADLALTISDDPDPVVRKQTLTYTLAIVNESPSVASNVMLVASLNGDVRGTPVADPVDRCSYSAEGKVNCLLGDPEGNGDIDVRVYVTPKKAGVFSIEGTVTSAVEDPDLSDNSDVEETQVTNE